MPVHLRPSKKLAKLLYKLMDAPKEEQQGAQKNPSKQIQEAWDKEIKQVRR